MLVLKHQTPKRWRFSVESSVPLDWAQLQSDIEGAFPSNHWTLRFNPATRLIVVSSRLSLAHNQDCSLEFVYYYCPAAQPSRLSFVVDSIEYDRGVEAGQQSFWVQGSLSSKTSFQRSLSFFVFGIPPTFLFCFCTRISRSVSTPFAWVVDHAASHTFI